jgi:predicted nucleotide-binding protein
MPWERFLSDTVTAFRKKFENLEFSQQRQIREKALDESLLEPCQIEVLDFGIRKQVIWLLIHDKLLPDMLFKVHKHFKSTDTIEFADKLPYEVCTLLEDSILRVESSTKPNGILVFMKNHTFGISHGAPPQSVSGEFLNMCVGDSIRETQDKKLAISNANRLNAERPPQRQSLSKNIFIVHGRDHEPMKKLKKMLVDFDLNPIILHEQPSGSRTVLEKLEKYSDVGYAFVILTPDDLGVSFKELFEKTARGSYENGAFEAARKILEQSKGSIERFVEFNEKFMQDPADASKFLQLLVPRARQNIILEFGYFMGRLGRQRVCCLYKGDIELPSDMQGIVYIPFEQTINEIEDRIVKELEEAGYKIEKRQKEAKYPAALRGPSYYRYLEKLKKKRALLKAQKEKQDS